MDNQTRAAITRNQYKFTEVGLAIEIDTSLPAERVIRVLEQVVVCGVNRRPFGSTMARTHRGAVHELVRGTRDRIAVYPTGEAGSDPSSSGSIERIAPKC